MPGWRPDMPGWQPNLPGWQPNMPGWQPNMPGWQPNMPGVGNNPLPGSPSGGNNNNNNNNLGGSKNPPPNPTPCSSLPVPAGSTSLFFYNATANAVDIGCVLQAPCPIPCSAYNAQTNPNGCTVPYGNVTNVKHLGVVDTATCKSVTVTQLGAAQNGWFQIQPFQTVQIYNNNPGSNGCIAGLIMAVGTFGVQCPCGGTGIYSGTTCGAATPDITASGPAAWPNGNNACEATINVPGVLCDGITPGGTTEAFDITCEAGVGHIYSYSATAPSSGPFWNWGSGAANTQSATTNNPLIGQNQSANLAAAYPSQCDQNCAQTNPFPSTIGVYPVGQPECNVNTSGGTGTGNDAPPCLQGAAGFPFNQPAVCQPANNFCLVQRGPNPSAPFFDGTLIYTYVGPNQPQSAPFSASVCQ